MTTTYISADSIGTDIRFSNDIPDSDYVVRTGVTVRSTTSSAFVLKNSGADVVVRGLVGAASWAISLGDDYTRDGGHSVTVAQGGSLVAHDGIRLMGSAEVGNAGLIDADYMGIYAQLGGSGRTTITNAGQIQAGHDGILAENYGTTTTQVLNDGTIAGGSYGIRVGGGAQSTAQVTNHGTVSGAINSFYGGSEADRLVNRGLLKGDVWLGAGNDVFDDRGGRLSGKVFGYSGDDRFCPGARAETLDGGVGLDTLDFRSGGGVQVSLAKGTGTAGAAAGDTYKGFEIVLGSRSGADVLEGDAGANRLQGLGGADVLKGLAGDDVLTGGDGADRLAGGLGDDAFVFLDPRHDADVIADFHQGFGDNDHLEIGVAGFGGGLAAGVLSPDQFRVHDDNHALDANDRFVFRTTDRTLWFDADGKGGAAPVLVADLQPGATLTSADILLV